MARAGRFSTVAPLPPHGEWRRALALDRGAGAPRPVVLGFVPAGVLDAPERLAALVRDVEAAARLHHPAAIPVRGTETVGDALAVVEDWRAGATLRALLDAGGRLPPDVAARVAVDVCGALARAHATDAGEGRPLAHGAVSAAHVLVGEDGVSRLCGFGEGAGAEPADDVRAFAAILHECLAGEPPGPGAAPLDVPGVPAALAAAVDGVLRATPGSPPPTAAGLSEAVIAAGAIAAQADVASYAEAILPAEEGGRGALRRAVERAAGDVAEEVSEDSIVEPTDPAQPRPAVSRELPRPPQTRPGVDPAGSFRAPAPRARSAAPVVAAVAALCAVLGFGVGLALSWAAPPPPPVALEAPPSPAAEGPSDVPAPAASPTKGAAPAPVKGTAPARAKAARAPKAAPKTAKAAAQRPPEREPEPEGSGFLAVTAPADAEVFLDGKRIGRGNLKLEVSPGWHRLEVRRGEDSVAERFIVGANETWNYEVTPTP